MDDIFDSSRLVSTSRVTPFFCVAIKGLEYPQWICICMDFYLASSSVNPPNKIASVTLWFECLLRYTTTLLTRGMFSYIFPIMLVVELFYHNTNLVKNKNNNDYITLGVTSFGVHGHLHFWVWDIFGPRLYDRTPMVSYIKMTVTVWSNGLFGS